MKTSMLVFAIGILSLTGCKSSVKQQKDSVYSRHLQQHIELTVITTPMPDKKEEMNLLLFNDATLLDRVRAKKIIDSLYKKKLIQPLTLVAFKGKNTDYGLEETGGEKGNQYRKFNAFISDELYPFTKKKVVIRKFNSVAICGFNSSALSAFDVAFNHDDKIQMAGIFNPSFSGGGNITDSAVLQTVQSLRKRPELRIWMSALEGDSVALKFKTIVSAKPNISEYQLKTLPGETNNNKLQPSAESFAEFLMWAFPR